MASMALIIRPTTILSSLAITALSLTVFYKTGTAFLRLATHFPPDQYVWQPTSHTNYDVDLQMVGLKYDWSTENFIWAAAGSSVVAGLLSMIVEVVRQCRRRNNGKVESISGALSATAILFATVALVVSLVGTVYTHVHHDRARSTCNWAPGQPVRDSYTCTRERAACDMIQYMANRDVDARRLSCRDIKFSRHGLIPLTILSALVALGYGAQMWLAKKERKRSLDAEKVRQLQEEELDS